MTRVLQDVLEAHGLLTRLPIRLRHRPRGADAAWAYPLAGLSVGAIGSLVGWLVVGLTPGLAAALSLGAMIFVTGALHEDGLADTADGLLGGWTKERRLEIMRDSRIGAYGVLALIIGLLCKWSALSALFSAGQIFGPMIAAAAMSRAPMVLLMWLMPHARQDGLSALTGRPDALIAGTASMLALVVGAFAFGAHVLWVALLLLIVISVIGWLARAKIGGQTGDILGATQQVSELAVLSAATAYVL